MKNHSTFLRLTALALFCCGVLILLAGPLAAQNQPATAAPEAGSSLTVHVSGLRNATGQLRVRLTRDQKDVEARAVAIDAKSLTAQVVFDHLPQGVYAVSLIHDENGNGQLDYGAFGAPSEGYGFSNNPPKGFGPPPYEATTFPVNQAKCTAEIKLIYW